MRDESTSKQPDENLTPADQRLIEVIRTELDPGERSSAERAAFRARLEGRIEDRTTPLWKPLGIAATAALAALAFWIAQPTAKNELGIDPDPKAAVVASETGSVGLLAYAYYETDYLGSNETESDFLPDEFQAIANAFDVP